MKSETTTLTMASATNAAIAPQNAAACAEPRSTISHACAKWATAAPNVPATRPQNPPHGVIRFQNMPTMNVANSGALKNENNSWM